jgi:hypothetical protein
LLGHKEEIDRAVRAGDVAIKTDTKTEYHLAYGEKLLLNTGCGARDAKSGRDYFQATPKF